MERTRMTFSMIEWALAISIVCIVAAVAIIIIQPMRESPEARNVERWIAVNTIANAIAQYAITHDGSLPADITAERREICGVSGACAGYIDLYPLVPQYLLTVPVDPVASGDGSGYALTRTADGRLIIEAIRAEKGEAIIAK